MPRGMYNVLFAASQRAYVLPRWTFQVIYQTRRGKIQNDSMYFLASLTSSATTDSVLLLLQSLQYRQHHTLGAYRSMCKMRQLSGQQAVVAVVDYQIIARCS